MTLTPIRAPLLVRTGPVLHPCSTDLEELPPWEITISNTILDLLITILDCLLITRVWHAIGLVAWRIYSMLSLSSGSSSCLHKTGWKNLLHNTCRPTHACSLSTCEPSSARCSRRRPPPLTVSSHGFRPASTDPWPSAYTVPTWRGAADTAPAAFLAPARLLNLLPQFSWLLQRF